VYPVNPVGPNDPVDTITQLDTPVSYKNVYAPPGPIVATVDPDTVTVMDDVLVDAFDTLMNVPSGTELVGRAIA
jgi:hypothetical protein